MAAAVVLMSGGVCFSCSSTVQETEGFWELVCPGGEGQNQSGPVRSQLYFQFHNS